MNMATCLLYHHSESRASRFYRIELAMNLFSEVSVLREWGQAGRQGQTVINSFSNLRDASLEADRHRNRLLRKGYQRA